MLKSIPTGLMILFFSTALIAQDSKSKASDKVYEKGGVSIELKNIISINTPRLEFSPAYYLNGIVYVTEKKNAPIDPEGRRIYDLFYAETDRNGMLLPPEDFSLNLNSELYEGPVCFNKAGDVIYFTRSNMRNGLRKSDKEGTTCLKIFEAKKGLNDWESIKELPFNNDNYNVCHPSLTSDGNRLYFSSDMPGGKGGYDIYYSDKEGGQWSPPVNLGPGVNTDKNEVFPFIHFSSQTIFFSSNAHGSLGGLDIFSSKNQNDNFEKAKSLGDPFCSLKDDLGLIMNEEGNSGYFASNREGGFGSDDIYLFNIKGSINEAAPVVYNTKIFVHDAVTGASIDDSGVRIFEMSSDNFIDTKGNLYDVTLLPEKEGSNELVLKLVRKNADDLGKPDFFTNTSGLVTAPMREGRRYLIIATKADYESNEITVSTNDLNDTKVVKIPLNTKKCLPFTGSVFANDTKQPLQDVVIKLTNSCDGTVKELRSGRNGVFDYCLKPGCFYTFTADKSGFQQGFTTISPKADEIQPLNASIFLTEQMPDDLGGGAMSVGQKIVLNNIYYDFNKSAIRQGAARELDALANLMRQMPGLEIELTAHTDSRGGTEFNQKLSQQRAISARNYLVSLGIAEKRIVAIGLGEAQLRNKCADGVECSEADHQYNRRTEVKITKLGDSANINVEYGNNPPEVIDGRNE